MGVQEEKCRDARRNCHIKVVVIASFFSLFWAFNMLWVIDPPLTLSSYTSIPSCVTSILNMKIPFYSFFFIPLNLK